MHSTSDVAFCQITLALILAGKPINDLRWSQKVNHYTAVENGVRHLNRNVSLFRHNFSMYVYVVMTNLICLAISLALLDLLHVTKICNFTVNHIFNDKSNVLVVDSTRPNVKEKIAQEGLMWFNLTANLHDRNLFLSHLPPCIL